MRELLVKAWLRSLIVGLSLCVGFFGGSWATMQSLSRSIQTRIETVAELNRDIGDARRTLAQLEVDTWGLVFHEIEGERFVVGAGRGADPSALVGGRPSGVEAVERVKEVHTALEEQLTKALRRLSAQYETEQRRHSGQVEALQGRVERQRGESEALRQRVERLSAENEVLQRQIERLDVLATRLAEYFGTSAVARPRGLRI